jgi:predicted Zn-dependent protease
MTEEEFEVAFEEALTSSQHGDMDDAIRRMRSLLTAGMRRSVVAGMLGLWLYYEKEHVAEALLFLREAVSSSPKNERFSLGLFHALLDKNEVDAAFDEARRYLANNESEAYRTLIRDLANDPDN